MRPTTQFYQIQHLYKKKGKLEVHKLMQNKVSTWSPVKIQIKLHVSVNQDLLSFVKLCSPELCYLLTSCAVHSLNRCEPILRRLGLAWHKQLWTHIHKLWSKNEEENSFIHEFELKGLAFRAARFVILCRSRGNGDRLTAQKDEYMRIGACS
jgi:hypothetical protein